MVNLIQCAIWSLPPANIANAICSHSHSPLGVVVGTMSYWLFGLTLAAWFYGSVKWERLVVEFLGYGCGFLRPAWLSFALYACVWSSVQRDLRWDTPEAESYE